MNRIVLLMLALVLTAGCGQSDDTTVNATSADGATTAPAAVTPAPTTAEVAVPAPDSSANTPEEAPATEPAERIELAQADLGAVEAAGFVEGRHYLLISPSQPTNSSPGEVEVNEFFMHSCIHCYNLEPYGEAWVENKPDYINFVPVPTTWDEVRILHAQAFYVAESLGITDQIMMPFFREFHDVGNYLETPDKLAAFFARFDVSREDFESQFNSFGVMTKVNTAAQLGQRYRVDSTPTVIVNGKYRTGVDRAGGPEALFELIELLAAAERSQ